MTAQCPCCGGPVDADSLDVLIETLTPTAARIIAALRSGRRMSAIELADAVYADDIDGGPESAPACISTILCRIKGKLHAAGWQVSLQGTGEQGYRLRPINQSPQNPIPSAPGPARNLSVWSNSPAGASPRWRGFSEGA